MPRALLLLGGALLSPASAYLHGDAVGILLRTHAPSTGPATVEAYRRQLPRFGVSTKARFDVSSLFNNVDEMKWSGEVAGGAHISKGRNENMVPNEHLRLSLSFDEGFHRLPWLDVYHPRKHQALDTLTVTMVYSGSDGTIHAVHREAKYADVPAKGRQGGGGSGAPKSFTVEYIWINEGDVDADTGFLALFAAVLIVSLSGMVGACTSSNDDGIGGASPGKGGRYKDKRSSSSLEVGAGAEGFAKRL